MLRQFVKTTQSYKHEQPMQMVGFDWCTKSPTEKYNELFKC